AAAAGGSPATIPTLSQWGQWTLAALMLGVAVLAGRRTRMRKPR
ncbi:MAG: IPTL-CTERM sorting domain-containing protein, partial [Rhodospirillaceae bacterium]|nr:IPTL-CTERM sorting domain-containing protein [Rhodospirillaceae bacterium]